MSTGCSEYLWFGPNGTRQEVSPLTSLRKEQHNWQGRAPKIIQSRTLFDSEDQFGSEIAGFEGMYINTDRKTLGFKEIYISIDKRSCRELLESVSDVGLTPSPAIEISVWRTHKSHLDKICIETAKLKMSDVLL